MGIPLTTHLSINLPLPIDVANNLILAIGKLYPSSLWEGSSGVIKMSISDSDRFRGKQEINEAIEGLELHEAEPATGEFSYTNFSPDLVSLSGPERIAQYCIPIVESSFNEIGAENYLEYRFHNPETKQGYHLIFQKSGKFTPAELREQAVAKMEEAQRKLAAYENPKEYESFAELASLAPNTILTSTEGNVLVITEHGVSTVGTSQPVTETSEGFTAPYTVVREG